MLKKICFILVLTLQLFSNEIVSNSISLDNIFEDIKVENVKAMKMGYKETFKTKTEFFDWNTNAQFVMPAIDKLINSSILYGKPEVFFITYENKKQDLITYTCQLREENCESCQVIKKELSEKPKDFIFDCMKIENKFDPKTQGEIKK